MNEATAREWRMVSFPPAPDAAGGNPAGVVLDPEEASPAEMTRTAVRLNPLSETAFVWPPATGPTPEDEAGPGAGAIGDGSGLAAVPDTEHRHGPVPPPYRLRYFAPGGEVDLCGHATAAAFAVLARSGRLGDLPAGVRSVAPGGSVVGRVVREDDGLVVWMDMPVARRVDVPLDLEEVAAALGLPVEVMASRPAAAVEDVGIRVALLPVADLSSLDAMRPDFERLRAIGRPSRIIVFYPFVLDADAGRVRARSFAPAVDIDEDPATGTAAASLGAYLAREGLVGGATELRIRQGEAMGHPSELRLVVRHEARRPVSIRVGGWVAGGPVPA